MIQKSFRSNVFLAKAAGARRGRLLGPRFRFLNRLGLALAAKASRHAASSLAVMLANCRVQRRGSMAITIPQYVAEISSAK